MDQKGGCCIARYAGGAYDISKMDKIMLRFRPIAPKPASSSSATPESSGPSVKRGRGKRKYVSKRTNDSSKKKRRKSSPENTDSGGSVTGGEKEIRTLTLLPEGPDVKEPPKRSSPLWLSFDNGGGVVAPAPAMGRRVVVGSWVRVECVTDAWLMDSYVYGAGRTDEERVRGLDADTCPGFISDGSNKVRWTNEAYRRMVAGKAAALSEVAAWLVMEEGVALPLGCAAFTCRVRVVTCGKEASAKTVPCDVWKMDCGGFAWRLDTTAALSLWIGN